MKRTILSLGISFATVGTALVAQSKSIHFEWLNVPCTTNINCDNGCSACNVPENSSPNFFGTNMIWPGLTLCPHTTVAGDNAVYTYGWPTFVAANTYAMFSGLSTVPMQVDTLVIRHRSDAAGPERLKISMNTNAAQPHEEVADVYVGTEWQETILTDLGRMEIGPGMAFGTLQVKLQAYGGQGGSWHIDAMRVVGSPAQDEQPVATGIMDIDRRIEHYNGPVVDVLGRSVGNDPAPGVYIGGQRVVRVY